MNISSKNTKYPFVYALSIILIQTLHTAWAQDAAAQTTIPQSAECANLQHMDMSKMNANDPDMQALMQKCSDPAKTNAKPMAMDNMQGMNDMKSMAGMKGMTTTQP